ncbi:UDP-glucose pyrophosphorylase [Sulfurivirga caldicuralii]|uniref:UTP--glucose-1-phosphate uridylyltransferase n=1 Tax=Sulfurivirga caldicuralii TaxID=364032 RepID=A0A1N6DQ27_9GAMM|nr:UTP--glucose-1-phosphate uridylyltransferase GalU [Sulfurivirga caldicuralii]SIN72908.1 UDP-glucose pyrophosphorylase [Sulfurivirga caldicuralii]
MSTAVKTAVLPVAGLGTRFLPATKAIPKEMITLVDKPLIQYVVEEAAAAGIERIVFVTHSSKRAIEDHFDKHYELEAELARRGKTALLAVARQTAPAGMHFAAVRQPEALGLGHAVLCAAPVVGNEPFVVMLPDVLLYRESGSDLADMIARFEMSGASQILVEPVPPGEVNKYGVVDLGGAPLRASEAAPIRSLVEKPAPEQAPSNLAVVGRYVLTPRVFELLAQTEPGAGGEIQLTDALDALLAHEAVEAFHMAGQSYDCGDKLGYLRATLAYGLRHPDLGEGFRALVEAGVS